MIDTGEILAALSEKGDPPNGLPKIVGIFPTGEGALLVIYEKPDHRIRTRTHVACFKHGKLAWSNFV